MSPFLIFNQVKYNNALAGFIEGLKIIHLVGVSTYENIFYYPLHMLTESVFVILAPVGIFFLFKNGLKKNQHIWAYFIFSLFFFVYLSTLARKEMRYMIIIIPFVYILALYGLKHIKLKYYWKQILMVAVFFIIAFQSLFGVASYYYAYAVPMDKEIYNEYLKAPLEGFTVLSGPALLAYQDIPHEIIYWTRPGMFDYYEEKSPEHYIINTCDLFCPEGDNVCEEAKKTFLNNLKKKYNIKFSKELNRCEYYVFD